MVEIGAKCPRCGGSGKVWSNFEGSQYEGECTLCGGIGVLEDVFTLARQLEQSRREAAEAQGELEKLRTHVALYLECTDMDGEGMKDAEERGERLVAMRLAGAPRPAVWTETWLDYLRRAARIARIRR